jgi:hypothetical protein
MSGRGCLKAAGEAHSGGMKEPGLDRHEWETEWAALEPLVADSPAEALPELDDLVERMLVANGYNLDDPIAREGEEREVVAEFLAAREIVQLVETGDDAVGPGDVGAAVEGFRSIYEFLAAERRTP